jgi:hypothetical protein
MPRKSKQQKVIEVAAEKQEIKTFQPYTYISCLRASLWDGGNLNKGSAYLFMGWITNAPEYGKNSILMDDRGVFLAEIREEDFEVCK